MPAKTLSADQARNYAKADARVTAARDELVAAEKAREELRERYGPRVPIGEPITVGGVRIKRSKPTSGPSFSIAKFLERHKLTAAMRPFFKPGKPYELWDVRQAK